MPDAEGREVRMLKWVEPGLRQKLHYLRYMLWSMWVCVTGRADLVYCSDPFGALPGLLLRKLGFRVIYHEHDSPNPGEDESLPGPIVWGRRGLLRQASLVVFPNALRLERAMQWAAGTRAESMVVWNCPAKDDLTETITTTASPSTDNVLRLYYHGTLVPDRLPLTLLNGIARCSRRVELTLVGYTTVGAENYDGVLKENAAKLGIEDQLHVLGALKERSDVIEECRKHDVGLVLFTGENWQDYASEMAGASNKPFDYLSQGLAVIVPDNPEWQRLYVDRGCAMAVDVEDVDALAKLFDWLAEHPEEIKTMGSQGRGLIEQEWIYETQFQPVLEWITHG